VPHLIKNLRSLHVKHADKVLSADLTYCRFELGTHAHEKSFRSSSLDKLMKRGGEGDDGGVSDEKIQLIDVSNQVKHKN
jgi:hypothetical protein